MSEQCSRPPLIPNARPTDVRPMGQKERERIFIFRARVSQRSLGTMDGADRGAGQLCRAVNTRKVVSRCCDSDYFTKLLHTAST